MAEDASNFSVKISELYASIFSELDNIRSNADIVNVKTGFSNDETKSNYLHAPVKQLNAVPSVGNVTPPPYESRCHAFYRNIGLPVVDPTNKNFFNPGYDPDANANKEKISNYVNISNNFINSNLGKISLQRQDYIFNLLNIFSLSNIDSSVLTLSLINKRKLNGVMEGNAGNIFDLTEQDQSYDADYLDVNNNDMLTYAEYTPKKTLPEKLKLFNKDVRRKHIIRPFMTDPRISFTAKSNSVNVPFLLKPSQYPPPMIDTICRTRFAVDTFQTDYSDYQREAIQYVKEKNLNISNNLKAFISPTAAESNNFYNFIAYAKALSKAIKENIKKVKEVQRQYHILPIPNGAGPEKGISTSKIYYQDEEFNTFKDVQIVDLTKAEILDKLNLSVIPVNEEDAPANTITNKKPIKLFPFNVDQSPGSGDNTQTSLGSLNAERTSMFNQANAALQEIEYALGEFSGFGLCDAFVIQYALLLMKKEALAGLLDQDALKRMQTFPSLKLNVTPLGIEDSLKEFESTVSSLYQLFDQIYQDETDPVAND